MKCRNSILALTSVLLFLVIAISCQKILPKAPNAEDALDAPIEGLTLAQNRLFVEGAAEFDEVYTDETGLGPIFVASSCGSCHSGDNKGHPFTMLTRFGQSDTTGNAFMDFGAPQLQHNFIVGHMGEQLPIGASASNFIAPIVSGSGYLELVSDVDILNLADPNDADGDGVSGRPNWNSLPDWVTPFQNAKQQNGKFICRFGKKASTYNVHQQTVQAFNQDMGITSSFMPNNPVNYLSGLQSTPGADPEISDKGINATVFYIQTLQTPFRRNPEDEEVQRGAAIFAQVKCNSCHVEKLKTGFSPVSALSYKEFAPFTDLLLHDMGPALDDHYTEGGALSAEWRTAPLWGLGLSESSQGGKYFLMHDGRAKSIVEAIGYHGGEAQNSRNLYTNLPAEDQAALVKFLKSL